MIDVYTDGASSPDGAGGWAWTDGKNHESGHEEHTTNQRMEMMAVIKAIQAHDEPIQVHSDSAYVINCFKQRWYVKWERRGWLNSNAEPVKNKDLWDVLIPLVLSKKTTFVKVKGHSGHRLNNLADKLAVEAKVNGREQRRSQHSQGHSSADGEVPGTHR